MASDRVEDRVEVDRDTRREIRGLAGNFPREPLHDLEQRLGAVPEIVFAYLFGSRARGTARPDSDWDLAIYLRQGLSPQQRFKLRLRLLAELEELGPSDLVILNDAPPLLAHRAIMGRRLVVRDATALVRFSVRTLAQSEDQRPWRELHRRARQRRLEEVIFGRP